MTTELLTSGMKETLEHLREVRASQCDLIVKHRSIEVDHDRHGLLVQVGKAGVEGSVLMPLQSWALPQLCQRARTTKAGGAPPKYIGELLGLPPVDGWPEATHDAHDLAARNLNHWLDRSSEKRSMVRTWSKGIRAVVSDSYRPIDNHDVLFKALAAFESLPSDAVEVRKMWADERHLTIQAIGRESTSVAVGRMYTHAPGEDLGDPRTWTGPELRWFPMVTIQNSDTGHSRLSVSPGLWCQWCNNAAKWTRNYGQIHAGSKREETMFLKPETIKAENELVLAKVGDWIERTFDAEVVREMATDLVNLGTQRIDTDQEVKAATAVVVDAAGLTKDDEARLAIKFGVERERLDGTGYAMFQALTSLAQDVSDPRKQLEIETTAGRIAAGELVLVK